MRHSAAFTMIELMIVIAIIAIIAAIAIPGLLSARKAANETAAIGALKTIHSAQALFRDGDKDGDGADYGTLTELTSAGYLLDPALADGNKQGYRFETGSCTDAGGQGAALYIIANPMAAGSSGDRSFCTGTSGVIYFTSTPIAGAPLTTTGKLPAGVLPLR